jgi:hypothetical protein
MIIRRLLTYSLLSLMALGAFFWDLQIDIGTQTESRIEIVYEGNGVYACDDNNQNADGTPCIGQSNMSNPQSTSTTAPGVTKPADQSTEMKKMLDSIIAGANVILWILTIAVSPAIMFAWWLMSPDWTSGDLFGLREPMYNLWVTVSNIVYFIYAIILILIALGTMFGKESFSYKVMLPKLALGILMVPFTWWFVQWTISISAVVTASVITIPSEALSRFSTPDSWWERPTIPKTVNISNAAPKDASLKDTTPPASTTNTQPLWKIQWVQTLGVTGEWSVKCIETPTQCTSPKALLNSAWGMYSYMLIYAYSVFKFDKVQDIDTTLGGVKVALQLVNQTVMGILMFIVFGVLTLALVSMLLVRAIKLWIYAIFSPLFTFQFVAGWAMKWVDKSDTFTIKEFIGLCFVPAIVWLSLSFGLIIISVVSSPTPDSGKKEGKCTTGTLQDTGCKIADLMGNPANNITKKIEGTGPNAMLVTTVKMGEFQMNFKWKIEWAQMQSEADSANNATGVLDAAGGMFGTIIIDMIALMFIWMAFMAAKNVSKAVEWAIKPFEDMWSKVATLAKSLPKYTPIPFSGGMSVASMWKTVELATSQLDTKLKKNAESTVEKLFPSLVEGIIKAEKEAKLKQDIWNIQNTLPIDSRIGKTTSAVAEAQSWAQYSANNMSKLTDAIKDRFTSKDTDELKKYFDAHGIKRDSKESEALIKMYTWVTMNENDKMLAWGANTRLWTGSSTNPGGASGTRASFTDSEKNNFNVTLGNKTISYNFKDKKWEPIPEEMKAELKKMKKSEFIDVVKVGLSPAQVTQLMTHFTDNLFAKE